VSSYQSIACAEVGLSRLAPRACHYSLARARLAVMMIIPPPDPPFGDTSLLTRLPLAALALVIIGPLHAAEPWPMWRGTRLDGVATEHAGFPVKWSATENIAWKTEIPGRGHSSPIVWGDRIYVTSCVEQTGERLLICLDRASGAIRWRQTV